MYSENPQSRVFFSTFANPSPCNREEDYGEVWTSVVYNVAQAWEKKHEHTLA